MGWSRQDFPGHLQAQIDAKIAAQELRAEASARRTREGSVLSAALAAAGALVKEHAPAGRWGVYRSRAERDYADWLNGLLGQGQICAWWHEPLRVLLGGRRNTYTPDFVIQPSVGPVEAHEVKGYWREDARVKFKTAAARLPWLRWAIVTRERGAWRVEYVN